MGKSHPQSCFVLDWWIQWPWWRGWGISVQKGHMGGNQHGSSRSRRDDSIYIGAQPPNPATNKSVLSADLWSFWTLYLGCMLLCHHFCKQRYYKHFIELVKLLHICLQFKITTEETYGLQGFHQMGRRLWEVSKFVYSTKIYTDERCITNTHLIIYQHAQ